MDGGDFRKGDGLQNMKPISIPDRIDYQEMKQMISEISARVNLLTEMIVRENEIESTQEFNFSETLIQLDTWSRKELSERIESLRERLNAS